MSDSSIDASLADDQAPCSTSHECTGRRLAALTFGALGVVYGDIGTSPLYAVQTAFTGPNPVAIDRPHVFGVISLIFWTLMVIVSFKYALLVMRADHRGQGGSLALLALVSQLAQQSKFRWFPHCIVILGISAGALFYGDSMITPAISVLSAVEGIDVVVPGYSEFIIPITLIILASLFFIQPWGTGVMGRFFGPITSLWFLAIALVGLRNIVRAPEIVYALSPWYALSFLVEYKTAGFLALAAVFLCVTGAEALYADLGHFGRKPIRRAWFMIVLPALILNYLGQGALLLTDPKAAENPFYLGVPSWCMIPMIVLATLATVIASQATISGAFSITRQAMQLGFIPRMKTVHTSETEIGQIYVPFVNWTLFVFVAALVIGFGSSNNLAAAYGVAVAGTMLITTVQVSIVMHSLWQWNKWLSGAISLVLFIVDLAFFSANATKIPHGGWFPLAVGLSIFILLTTWKKGRELLIARRSEEAMPDDAFLKSLNPNVTRVAGTSVFLSGTSVGVPHALMHNLKHNRVVHERVVFLTVVTEEIPHVDDADRIEIHHLGRRFYRFIIRFGYLDETNLPVAMKLAAQQNFEINDMETSFFLGRDTIIPSRRPGMALWRERLFAWMTRSATSAMDFFHLPPNRVVELGTQVEI